MFRVSTPTIGPQANSGKCCFGRCSFRKCSFGKCNFGKCSFRKRGLGSVPSLGPRPNSGKCSFGRCSFRRCSFRRCSFGKCSFRNVALDFGVLESEALGRAPPGQQSDLGKNQNFSGLRHGAPTQSFTSLGFSGVQARAGPARSQHCQPSFKPFQSRYPVNSSRPTTNQPYDHHTRTA